MSHNYRAIVERHLGRKLKPTEDVHHRDDNQQNNALMNLEVKSHGDHSSHTGRTKSLRKLRHALSMPQRKEKLY